MPYIDRDGTIRENAPWNLQRIVKFFYGAFYFVIYFFQTLVGMETRPISYGRSSSGGSSFGGSSSGGGGGGGGGGGYPRPGGGGGGPSKRIMTMKDINPPTIGGCPGGACGR